MPRKFLFSVDHLRTSMLRGCTCGIVQVVQWLEKAESEGGANTHPATERRSRAEESGILEFGEHLVRFAEKPEGLVFLVEQVLDAGENPQRFAHAKLAAQIEHRVGRGLRQQ